MAETCIRLGGAVLVIIACTGLGCYMAGRWKEHVRMIEQLRTMIFLLKGEIVYANSPLTEAFERTGRKGGGCLGELFIRVAERMESQQGEPFYTIWQEEIGSLSPEICLSKEDRQSLSGLGEHLGYLDVSMQERTILLYLEQLDMSLTYLRGHQQERTRLYTSLGVMVGIFLTIIMY